MMDKHLSDGTVLKKARFIRTTERSLTMNDTAWGILGIVAGVVVAWGILGIVAGVVVVGLAILDYLAGER